MGRFAMEFHGICMHLNGDSVGLPPDVRHRVVGVDASKGYDSVTFFHLPPHVIFLEAATPDVATRLAEAGLPRDKDGHFRLNAARITLGNAAGQPLQASIGLLPRLAYFAPAMVLRSELTGFTEPQTGDCFVDMTHGVVEGRQFAEGGIYSRWTVDTTDDPALTIVRAGEKPITVPLPSTPPGAVSLTFKNGTTDRSDKKYDFALHYLAAVGGIDAQEFAHDFPIDPDGSMRGGVDTSTSCSNSQYP